MWLCDGQVGRMQVVPANAARGPPSKPIPCHPAQPGLYPGGSWAGHFLPGLLFILWGLHWWQGTYNAYFKALAR